MTNYFQTLCISMIALTAVCISHAGQTGDNEPQTKKQLPQESNQKMDGKTKVVFHLDWDQEERLLMALENTKNLFKEIPPQQCIVNMVANGKAVNLFRKDRSAKYASDMGDLHKLGVRFKACRNAMAKNKVEKTDLLDVCEVVPAGILEIINLQRDGFAYVKP